MSPISVSVPVKRERRDLRPVELLLILGVFATIAALRLPQTWVEGRFQDEEATVFLAYAWHFPSEALFRSFGGYLNIAANATTLILAEMIKGDVISLERAPYFTMLAGLASAARPGDPASQEPIALACRRPPPRGGAADPAGHADDRGSLPQRHAHPVSPGAGSRPDRRACRRGTAGVAHCFEGAVLLIAPLCGPAAIVFLPLFALRALVERDASPLAAVRPARSRRRDPAAALLPFDPAPRRAVRSGQSCRGDVHPPVRASVRRSQRRRSGRPHGGARAGQGRSLAVDARRRLRSSSSPCCSPPPSRRATMLSGCLPAAISVAAVSLGFGILTGQAYSAFFSLAGPRYNYIPLVLLGLCYLCLAARADPAERRTPRLMVALMLFVGAVHCAAHRHLRRGAELERPKSPRWQGRSPVSAGCTGPSSRRFFGPAHALRPALCGEVASTIRAIAKQAG